MLTFRLAKSLAQNENIFPQFSRKDKLCKCFVDFHVSRIKLINIQMNQFFYEDQVYKIDKKGVKFGLVVENEVSIS